MAVDIDMSGVMESRVVDVAWLKEHLEDDSIVIIDARSESKYEHEHIPGAINLNPNLSEELRTDASGPTPLLLQDEETLGEVFGEYGLAADDHIVVYSDTGADSGFLLSVLDYAGAENLSLVSGGIEAWEEAGYELTDEEPDYDEKTFEVNLHPEFVADNDFVKANLDNLDVVIVDVRVLQQSLGLMKHSLAARPGHIPGATLLPLPALYEDHGYVKSAEELLWVLKERNIRKDKTIVITCNTGNWAGAAQYMLRYLGYPNVKVHDESWVGWRM
jgi:3-mercaptopyruvate sulfurtransferase SseA